MNRWVRALVLGGMAIGGPAYAQAGAGAQGLGGPGRGGMWRMADADGDGVVTREEYLAAIDARFARMDANGDGVLSPEERPMRGGWRGPDASPPAAPANVPPTMTRDQYRQAAMRRFDAADANHDGRIDAAEMQAGRAMRGGEAPPPPSAAQ